MLRSLLLSGLVAAATAQTTNTSSQACVSGNAVHMIVARASLEPPGFGILQNISTRVMEQLPGSNAEAVVYPATLDDYQNSEGQGVAAMTQLVNNYAQACPNSKMVLMGYSQGAQVTADTVCGSTISGFAQTQAISKAVTDKVAAIMLMGDPTHVVNQPYDQGTATKNGVSQPRRVSVLKHSKTPISAE
jgi:acetylxylan esterase